MASIHNAHRYLLADSILIFIIRQHSNHLPRRRCTYMKTIAFTTAYSHLIRPPYNTHAAFCAYAHLAVLIAGYIYLPSKGAPTLRIRDRNQTIERLDIDPISLAGQTQFDSAHSSLVQIDCSDESLHLLDSLIAQGFETSRPRALARSMLLMSAVDHGLALGCTIDPPLAKDVLIQLPASQLDRQHIRRNRQIAGFSR